MENLRHDQCAYRATLQQSVAPIDYILSPIRYEHCNKCRPELGIVGGIAVSHISGSLVDLESNLLNIDRPATQPSQCPALLYRGPANDGVIRGPFDPFKTNDYRPIDTSLRHLQPCQFASYEPVPLPRNAPPFRCPAPSA